MNARGPQGSIAAEQARQRSQQLEQLLPLIYGELHGMASKALGYERANHTLQPTAVIHEVFLRMCRQRKLDTQDRALFLAAAAKMIRRILVDHSKKHNRRKRGGGRAAVTLHDELLMSPGIDLDLMMLHDALELLGEVDPRRSRLVELRFFGGLTMAESAEVLGVSERTAANDWVLARAWLRQKLRNGPPTQA